jgi:hypothetical protein
MRLSTEYYERAKHRPHPMAEYLLQDLEEQLELGDFPPMTANRARDFPKDCKRCERECGFCTDMRQHYDYQSDIEGR